VGQVDTIRWNGNGLAGNVTITINRNYPSGNWETLFSGTANDGAQPWTVTSPTSALCRIRIVGDSYAPARDSSDANFTISDASLTVISPNGGENWYWGETHNILWSSGAGGTVDISLNRNFPSGQWESVFSGTPNDGSAPWTVSSPTTTSARIRIVSTSNPAIRDSSNANFSISDPYLILLAPNGGEVWTAGNIETVDWIGEGLLTSDSIKIELNRDWPGPTWQSIDTAIYNYFAQDWPVTGPGTASARMRISCLREPSVQAESEANFVIVGANEPPLILHDPLHDGEPGNVTFVASFFDEDPGITAKVFYRTQGVSPFDSAAMSLTGNPNEFAATVGPLVEGSYDYFLRAKDADLQISQTQLYDFQLAQSCGVTIAYDDGSADRYNWAGGEEFRWAVKFTPSSTFVLCGAQVAVSRTKPDSAHQHILVEVYDSDGFGLPGTRLLCDTTGSVGNVVGGLPTGTTLWTTAVLRDETGEPLVLGGDFFIAVGNPDTLEYEAFARDTTGLNSGRSFLYDGCEEAWFNENDGCDNCMVGNRLVRAIGFYQTPLQIVVARSGNNAILYWTSTGAPHYRIYSTTEPFGTYGLEGTSTQPTFTDSGAVTEGAKKFYRVVSSTLP
jgi:hypothetical protein